MIAHYLRDVKSYRQVPGLLGTETLRLRESMELFTLAHAHQVVTGLTGRPTIIAPPVHQVGKNKRAGPNGKRLNKLLYYIIYLFLVYFCLVYIQYVYPADTHTSSVLVM